MLLLLLLLLLMLMLIILELIKALHLKTTIQGAPHSFFKSFINLFCFKNNSFLLSLKRPIFH
jgi:hypothetical protein